MSKAEYILLVSIIGLYAALCVMLFLRACVKYVHTRWSVADGKIEKVSRAVGFTQGRAWTRAVWRGNLA